MPDKIALFVGTNKGGFILTSDADRRKWDVSGPHLPGYRIFHMKYDPRTGTTFMVANHDIYGPEVARSNDLGATWQTSDAEPRYSEDSGQRLAQLWHVQPGRPSEPGVIYVGAEPASLWKSEDGGKNWSENLQLQEHPSRSNWIGGAGGLCLHTIILDPENVDRMSIGISAGGYFRTDDGGQSWDIKIDGLPPGEPPPPEFADFLPVDHDSDADQCIHKVTTDGTDPTTQYMQHHMGVFRSRDRGDSWDDIANGLPESFGFPIISHPRKAGMIWLIPNQSGEFRTRSTGAFEIYKSENGGDDWRVLTEGLPQEHAYVTTLRESMTVDGADPLGLYVGTKGGALYGSTDEGESWYTVAASLPPIFSVEAAVV